MTDVDLMSTMQGWLDKTYLELDGYTLVLGEDFLTTGITRFLKTLNDARGWSSRVLGLLMEARRYRDQAIHLAKGKKTLFEYSCIEFTKNERQSMPAGLDGHERKALAALANRVRQEDWQAWENITNELRTLIEVLEDKHKDLLSSKQDLRAQLWAVKLQGFLGELVSEAAEGEASRWEPTQPAQKVPLGDAKPTFAEGRIASEIETAGLGIDEILGKGRQ